MRTSGRYESAESGCHIGTAVTFLLIGLGAGALMGLMFAPKPGKQFRRDLQRGYEDAKDNFGDWADEAKDRVREVSERVYAVRGTPTDSVLMGVHHVLRSDMPDLVLSGVNRGNNSRSVDGSRCCFFPSGRIFPPPGQPRFASNGRGPLSPHCNSCALGAPPVRVMSRCVRVAGRAGERPSIRCCDRRLITAV